jgi:hypothetical protein
MLQHMAWSGEAPWALPDLGAVHALVAYREHEVVGLHHHTEGLGLSRKPRLQWAKHNLEEGGGGARHSTGEETRLTSAGDEPAVSSEGVAFCVRWVAMGVNLC